MVDRRTFVKASIGAGLVGAGAAAGLGITKPLALTGGGETITVEYPGAKRVAGPAPRGLPILPLEIDSEGAISGRVVEFDDITNLAWYQYCGHEGAPGLDPETSMDNVIEFFVAEDKLAQGFNPWYANLIGEPMNVNDFPEPGFGASGRWRSENQTGVNIITAIVIATGTDPDDIGGTGEALTFEGVDSELETLVRTQVEELGFLGFVSFCTHFCCVPGWKEDETARARGVWDQIFCTCHLSVYAPATIASDSFLLVREVEEEEA